MACLDPKGKAWMVREYVQSRGGDTMVGIKMWKYMSTDLNKVGKPKNNHGNKMKIKQNKIK